MGSEGPLKVVSGVMGLILRLGVLAIAFYLAYDIRMYAIREYGRLIHGMSLILTAIRDPRHLTPSCSFPTEFDPWFNFHATRYMFEVRVSTLKIGRSHVDFLRSESCRTV